MSARRAPGLPLLRSYPIDFTPAHCAGTSCLHSHQGEPVLPVFADVTTPVMRCDRRGAHGGHDITNDQGDWRCPGLVAGGLPAPRVVERAQLAREALRSTR